MNMSEIRLETLISAPIERCFDLSRSIDLHKLSLADTREEAIAGVTSGLIGLNEQVTWRARHFGVRQTLTSQINEYNRPHHFRDSMVQGIFRSFDHDHFFEERDGSTLMTDVFAWKSPLGLLGVLADKLFLANYLRRLLQERNRIIKRVAESDQWREILDEFPAEAADN